MTPEDGSTHSPDVIHHRPDGQQKSIYDEIPQVSWPTDDLSPEQIEPMVQDSRLKPLRELVARHLIQEGEGLYEELKANSSENEDSKEFEIAMLAINNGFEGAGRAVIDAFEIS